MGEEGRGLGNRGGGSRELGLVHEEDDGTYDGIVHVVAWQRSAGMQTCCICSCLVAPSDVMRRYGLEVGDKQRARADLVGPEAQDLLQAHFLKGRGYDLVLRDITASSKE